ncbi:MAG: hypothetical protein RJA19_634 [Bacteroidota bacterium]
MKKFAGFSLDAVDWAGWMAYVRTPDFRRVLLRVAGLWVLFLGFTWGILRLYSRHGAGVEVPKVTGMDFVQAQAQLEELGFETIHIDSIYSANAVPFEVVDQIPQEGSFIKENRRIYLTTYRATPPSEDLGVEEGMDRRVARITLENKGFNITERYEANIPLADKVVRVENAKGKVLNPRSQLPRGAKVTVVIGRMGGADALVPDVMGLTLDSARAVLGRSQFAVGLASFRGCNSGADSSGAVVVMQVPPADGTQVPMGTEIDLDFQCGGTISPAAGNIP